MITPNPKTSGGARWNYLAAWAYANDKFGGDDAKIRDFVGKLYKNVPVLDSGAPRLDDDLRPARHRRRSARLGERGVPGAQRARPDQFRDRDAVDLGKGRPPVALVKGNADAKGTTAVAQAYLDYLYSDAAQKIIAHNYYRPVKLPPPIPRT